MSGKAKRGQTANAIGVSAGTTASGLALFLPEGVSKYVLVMAGPLITAVASRLWDYFTWRLDGTVADWQIESERAKARLFYENLKSDKSASPEAIERAKQNLDALIFIQIEVSKKRVEALATS